MALAFRCSTASPSTWSGDALAVGLFAGEAGAATRSALAEQVGEALLAGLEQRRFKGKPGECLNLARLGQSPATLLVLGLGEPAGFSGDQLRAATASACKAAAAAGAQSLGLALPLEGLEPAAAAGAMAEAARLSLYADQRF